LLGDRWVNRPWNNYINWAIIVVLFALSLLLLDLAATFRHFR
jgi:hypothetical protein